jgi:ceramide glucosyltransferase
MAVLFVIHGLARLFLALAVAGAIYGALASLAAWRFLAGAASAPTGAPSVTILRPMRGAEPELEDNIESLLAQDYAGAVQVIVGVGDPADPALTAARRVAARHPERDLTVMVDPTPHGTNRKLGNLINMSAQLRGEILVISDSDVRLPPRALGAFVAALQRPGVGLVYGLYRGRPAGNLWSRIAALDVNARFAPSVVVGQALGAHPVLGPTMALRARNLAEAGGFERLKDVLADDFELGRLVRGLGLTIACPALLIDHVFPERRLVDLWTHELRWARTIRLLNPGGYAGSAITYVLPLALIGAILSGFSMPSLAMLIALTALRYGQGVFLTRLMRADGGVLWLLPLRDLLAFAVFLAAYFGHGVAWRGERLRVQSDGAMAPP